MSSRRSSTRRGRGKKPTFDRFKDHCRDFTAFMFSNVGIIILVILYTIGGAFIFQAIEILEDERLRTEKPHKFNKRNLTGECLERIWYITAESIGFDQLTYKQRVNDILLDYQRGLVHKQLEPDVEHQWSFSGAFLYSLTVITTIGYGNIAPRSDWGKLVTILYAIIGMPLFLLYLSNIGDVLAKSFKWIYSKVCLCRICPGVARRRIIRERRKMRQLARAAYENSDKVSTSTSNNRSDDYSETTQTQSSSIIDVYTQHKYAEEKDLDTELDILSSSDEITVPLTVCVMIMISYILSGAILFGRWEDWGSLDGSYFCFISLSSIGFGDLVPGDNVITADRDKVKLSFILCAVYLLLGMALIAMCFNLMQEEVIHNMRAIKRAFKTCFRCRR